MRDIKFRAWCKPRKELLHIQKMSFKNNKILPYGWNIEWHGENFELMQYTGLNDKNKKEIYEGDIVKAVVETAEYYKEIVGFVEFVDCTFVVTEDEIFTTEFTQCNFKEFEVIGNIYENPEKLKIESV